MVRVLLIEMSCTFKGRVRLEEARRAPCKQRRRPNVELEINPVDKREVD